MELLICFLIVLVSVHGISAQDSADVVIVVDGTRTVAEIDGNFICATIDWWPHDKCDYNQCPWESSSVINLDLSHPFLVKAVQAFSSLRIRIGGSLQDQVIYDVGSLSSPCHPFSKQKDGLFGFSKGCLLMNRWDDLNSFFKETGAVVTFGLNALYGRHQIRRGVWGGSWDSINALNFLNYTVSRGYKISSWEFGNELSGSGVGASVDATQYGKDLINLKSIINKLYENSGPKPSLIAPGGFYDKAWYTTLLQVSGSQILNVLTHHIYNLGAGVDRGLVNKILNPHYLDQISATFSGLQQTIQQYGPWASAWVGESGGAYNSGGRDVSDTYVNSFWYLDQLGMASKFNTKVYCRQTLIGGNYGLLNTTTFTPNPDYFSALLWHRLMGNGVLAVENNASPFLRTYAHCSKGREGVTLLLINLSNQTQFTIHVKNGMNIKINTESNANGRANSFVHGLKTAVSWVGSKASDESLSREEYHLTPENGYLQSSTMLLNGKQLKLTNNGDIPTLDPVLVDVSSPINVAPLSIAFISLPQFTSPACK